MCRFAEEGTSAFDCKPEPMEEAEIEPTHPVEMLTPMLEQLDELQPLPVVIGTWNRAFDRNDDPYCDYSKFTLTNMAHWANLEGNGWIERQLLRHAALATKEI